MAKEKMKACLECKEPTAEEMQSGTEHCEVPKEHAAVKPVRGLRKQHRERHLAVKCLSQPKEWTQGNCGSKRKLVTAAEG
jgi:hypothetical protein